MEENTSKTFVAGNADLAAAALMNVSGAGSSLFVINLCASMAPLANIGKSLPGLESYRLYQVARREDGRTRYRLRLGFFASQAAAEAVLRVVRSSYPTAFAACLCDEDRRFARDYVVEPAAPRIAVVVENKNVVKPVAAASVAAPMKPAAASSAAKPVATPAATPAKPAAAAAAPQPAKPAAAADPIEIELSWEPPALTAPANAPNAPQPQVVAPSFKTQEVIKSAPTPKPLQAAHKAAPAPRPAQAAPTATPAPRPAQQAAPKAPADKPNTAAKPPTKQTIESPSKLLASIELSLENERRPAPQSEQPKAPSSEPFRVSRGVEIPTTSLTLESTQSRPALAAKRAAAPAPNAPAKPASNPAVKTAAAPPAPKAPVKPAAEVSKLRIAQANAPAAIKAAVAPAPQKPAAQLPDLDSTQTIRALTSAELADESQEKWFAIQLAVSDQPVNLDAMPRLDIFEAYRLYSVASAAGGKITHALRIGFFREEVSAEAVSGYLKSFFASPTVVRISIAEQARFKDPPTRQPAPKAAVLDLSHARDRAPKAVPTVTMEVATPRVDPNATGSFNAAATGMHRALSSGSHKALSATGMHRALGATGTHKALKAASKAAPPPTKRSAPLSKSGATGKHKALQPKKSLEEQLLEEAREVELSQSGIRKLPKNDSLLSKMFRKK